MAKQSKQEAKAARLARTRFVKGRSGNPSGRPKGASSLLRELRLVPDERDPGDKQGRTYCETIARKMVILAAQGSIRAAGESFDRVHGRPAQFIVSAGLDSTHIQERKEHLKRIIEQIELSTTEGNRVN
jgi:hypothetical protein